MVCDCLLNQLDAVKKIIGILLLVVGCLLAFYWWVQSGRSWVVRLPEDDSPAAISQLLLPKRQAKIWLSGDIHLEKELLYDRYTLKDEYPYKDTVRSFKWTEICKCLAFVENMQEDTTLHWAVLANYKNYKGEAPLIKDFVRNEYGRVSDKQGVERYQSVPMYHPSDTVLPERYGRDGTLVRIISENTNFSVVYPVAMTGEWYIPRRYVRKLAADISFHHVVVVDRGVQHMAVMERIKAGDWRVRSMNPATTGVHRPPYAQETPLGMFLLQQKKEKMIFLKDGGSHVGGYAPYASRFTNGAYIHGVPVNVPQTKMIEYSWSLGTVPRSHMCVRAATSHARFIYDWAPIDKTLIIVIE